MNNNQTVKQQTGKSSPMQLLLHVIQGALIGLGAVLPGISGGVLSVIFGIYKPVMEPVSYTHLDVYKRQGLAPSEPLQSVNRA